MIRHLRACAPRHDLPVGEPVELLHLRAEAGPTFWLNLEADSKSTLLDLDQFLREVWLECCGHMSAFTIEGREYHVYVSEAFSHLHEQRDMDVELSEILRPGLEFAHTYDFRTPTELKIRVIEARWGLPEGPLTLLARNEAPVWSCSVCGRLASMLCRSDSEETEPLFFCREHGEKHDCGELDILPVVNSPRMGLCAYAG